MHKSFAVSRAVAALAVLVSTSAAAELAGPVQCVNPTWSSLAAGECKPGRPLAVELNPSAQTQDSVQLVDLPQVPGVPEPGTYALLIAGLAGVVLAVRRRRGS